MEEIAREKKELGELLDAVLEELCQFSDTLKGAGFKNDSERRILAGRVSGLCEVIENT